METTAASLLTGSYIVDPIHSSFSFAVGFQGVSIFRGTLSEAAARLVDGQLQGAAEVASISIHRPEQFRAHVLSAEFFDAENHPQVKFVSSNLDLHEDGTARIDGELTIKGISHPVRAEGRWAAPSRDAAGRLRGHLHVETVLDRRDYNLHWNAVLPSGAQALGNEVTLTVEASLVERTF